MTPTEILALRIADLEARLQLSDERIYFLTAELAQTNARLGITTYKTTPTNDHHVPDGR